jgi:outer membrane receptor protein involved in Fe transport
MSRNIVIAGLSAGLTCMLPLTALAQAAAAAASPASAADNGEIARVVITAQKRKEDIRDVPLSVSVITAETLKAQQMSTVEDITRNIPNVSFTTQAGPGLGTVEIRGVSSQAGSATVSVYLDDVSLTTRNLYSQGTGEPRFFDLQDVEVLRGPQGTLYGASSLGGTIKFISKQPDLKQFGGTVETTVSGTQHGGLNYDAQGVLNVPLIKGQAALRLGVEHGHDSGYIDQVDENTLQKISSGINSTDYTVFKAALKADFGNGWSITPALFAQQENTDDIDATYMTTQGGTPLPRFETSKRVREPGRDRIVVPSVTLVGDTGIGTFTGVLSGYKRRFNRIQDGTSINDPSYAVLDPASYPGLVEDLDALSSAVVLNNKIDQTSLELRMASKDYDPATRSHPFTWIGGVYVQDAVTQVFDNEPVFGVNATFAAHGFDAGNPDLLDGGFPGDFTNDSSYYSARHYHDKQSSVFGEFTWHMTPALSATAGLRYLVASQHFTREGAYFYAGGLNVVADPVDASWTASTPTFKVNWAVDPTTSIYANASKGFRLGGANRPIPDTALVESDLHDLGLPPGFPKSFAPDSLWSYEIGSKSDFLAHKVSLNLAAFYLDWKNIQQDITLPNAGYDFETNAGNAKSYGLEAELTARVTPNLTLRASAGFTRATFSADQPAFGVQTDADGNPLSNPDGSPLLNVRKGDWVEGVPRGSASLGADYHWAVNDNLGAFVRANGQWTGKSHGTLFRGDADYARSSYFTADASTGINWDRWELTAFVKNLTDTKTALQHPNIQGVAEAYYMRPRTIGMTANYEF